jgi:hypothetical protein
MSNCAIPRCPNQAVAWGLCAKHYMRKRRRGDPNAPFKRGRPPKPRPEGPEMVALRQENAALREEIQRLQRQLKAARTQAQNERLIWLEARR